MEPLNINSRLLARNAVMNLSGYAVPLTIGVISVPYVIHVLGIGRFGIVSLAFIIPGYIALFDMGMGKTATRFLAQALGLGNENDVRNMFWGLVIVQSAIGLLLSGMLFYVLPFIVNHILNMPPEFIKEANSMFMYLALSAPFILVSLILQGIFEASQKFHMVIALKIPSDSLMFLCPFIGVLWGLDLGGIGAIFLVSRVGVFFAGIFLCFRVFPFLLKKVVRPRYKMFKPLLSYGIWSNVANITGVLTNLDRYLIGAMSSVGIVAFYTVPYDFATRILFVPRNIVTIFFPAVSTLDAVGDRQKLEDLYLYSIKYLVLIVGFLSGMLTIFSYDILRIWLGKEFALESYRIFQVLSIGVLMHTLAYIPWAFISAMGRMDILAKVHIVELVLYLTAVILILKAQLGIHWIAISWAVLGASGAIFLLVVSYKMYDISPLRLLKGEFLKMGLFLIVFMSAIYTTHNLHLEVLSEAVTVFLLTAIFLWAVWSFVLAQKEKMLVRDTTAFFLRKIKNTETAKKGC